MEDRASSRGGALLVRADSAPRACHSEGGDGERIEHLVAHFSRWIGPPEQVFHETRAEPVHIDVHVIRPRPEHPFVTLFTTGMSARPMPGAPGCGHHPRRAELMMTLPARWALPPPDCGCGQHPVAPRRPPRGRDSMWPVRWLRHLARYVHEDATWLGWGHTVPNGHPPRPFGKGTRFCCMLVLPSLIAPQGVTRLRGPDGEQTHVFALYPLYREEVDLKLKEGAEELVRRMARCRVSDLVDVRRINVARGGGVLSR